MPSTQSPAHDGAAGRFSIGLNPLTGLSSAGRRNGIAPDFGARIETLRLRLCRVMQMCRTGLRTEAARSRSALSTALRLFSDFAEKGKIKKRAPHEKAAFLYKENSRHSLEFSLYKKERPQRRPLLKYGYCSYSSLGCGL